MRKKHWWILPALAILVVLTLIALDERLTLRTYTVASPKLTAEVRLRLIMRTTWWRWLLPVRRMLCCWLEICSMTTSPIVRRSGRYR